MGLKNKFISFMADCGVLTFGSFTLKSGRQAPYFINTGNYNTGAQMSMLGDFYAQCIKEHGIEADCLFGPAYKGIPLAVSAADALFRNYGIDVGYCFDRKEEKDHGEGGLFVGTQPADGRKIVIVEDTMTSGKALSEVIPKLKGTARVNITDMVISVDRKEKALGSDISAAEQAYRDYGITVTSIVDINDIITALEQGVIKGGEYIDSMKKYRAEYGA